MLTIKVFRNPQMFKKLEEMKRQEKRRNETHPYLVDANNKVQRYNLESESLIISSAAKKIEEGDSKFQDHYELSEWARNKSNG